MCIHVCSCSFQCVVYLYVCVCLSVWCEWEWSLGVCTCKHPRMCELKSNWDQNVGQWGVSDATRDVLLSVPRPVRFYVGNHFATEQFPWYSHTFEKARMTLPFEKKMCGILLHHQWKSLEFWPLPSEWKNRITEGCPRFIATIWHVFWYWA